MRPKNPRVNVVKLISTYIQIHEKYIYINISLTINRWPTKKIEGFSNESSSEGVIKTIVVEIARNLLKVSIYPS